MSRLPVKVKLGLWVCSLVAALTLAAFAALLTYADGLFTREVSARLEDAARDAADDVAFDESGQLKIDDDIEFYRDGVTVVVLDGEGGLLAGRLPLSFPEATPLGVHQMREAPGQWLVWDVPGEDAGLVIRAVASLSEKNAGMGRLIAVSAASYLGMLGVLALGCFLLTRRALAPIERIRRLAQSIQDGNQLSQRIPVAGAGDEVSGLALTFNAMFARLQAAFERESRFTADASHELRTPISVIIAQLDYALSQPDQPETVRSALEVAQERARHMSRLVNQLLLIARAQGGRIPFEPERVELSELCELVADDLAERAGAAGIALRRAIAPGVWVMGDETMLLQAILNLMDNALRYARPEGRERYVQLALDREGQEAVVRVLDNGIGIPPEHLERIWERFYRVDPTHPSGGTGLGLAMVRFIIERHGGRVTARSEGNETCFEVRLEAGQP